MRAIITSRKKTLQEDASTAKTILRHSRDAVVT